MLFPKNSSVFGSQNCVEVFIGGLGRDVIEKDIKDACAPFGGAVAVHMSYNEVSGGGSGFALVLFSSPMAALRATQELTQVGGRPVRVVYRAYGGYPSNFITGPSAAPTGGEVPAGDVNRLLALVRALPDRTAGVAAAYEALYGPPIKEVYVGEFTAENNNAYVRIENTAFLDRYPRCKLFVDKCCLYFNTPNKTPLCLLNEYAARMKLQLTYNIGYEGCHFIVDAEVTSIGDAVLYATGTGRGLSKKKAKQVAAAATLEMLLETVSLDDMFLLERKNLKARKKPFIQTKP